MSLQTYCESFRKHHTPVKQIITTLSIISFLFLNFVALPIRAQELSYYEKVEVVFVNKLKPITSVTSVIAEPPKTEPLIDVSIRGEVKKVDFLVLKDSKDFLMDEKEKPIIKKKLPSKQEVILERYEIGKLPEFPELASSSIPSSAPEGIKINTKENYSKEEVIELIKKYSLEYGLDEVRVLRIAKCESGFNPKATSPSGKYKGIMQFDSSFYGWAKKLGIENADPFNPEHNIRAATLAMSYGLWSKWSCK